MTTLLIRTILACLAPAMSVACLAPAMLVAQQPPQRDVAVYNCPRADSLMGPPGNLTHMMALQPQLGSSALFLPNTEATHQPGLRPGILVRIPQVPDDSLPGATLVVGFNGDVALE